jgi:hypothetical protein
MNSRARFESRPSRAVAIAVPYPAPFEGICMRDRLAALRDTLVVFGLQVVFRVTMLLRHLNY